MIKKLGVVSAVAMILFQISSTSIPNVQAANVRDVVINEVAWAGSQDNSADEWIELYNNTANAIDITGWTIEDDAGAQTYELSGTIPAQGYFLLENRETATSLTGDSIDTLSLSNSGDSLVLKDTSGSAIDTINGTSAAWPAGNNTAHASMERIQSSNDGNVNTNWQTSTGGTTATASNGSTIIGTPRAPNSRTTTSSPTSTPVVQNTMQLQLIPDRINVNSGEEVTFSINITNASDISNYGIDISYDTSKLQYIRSSEGSFLNSNATTTTSFHSALQNAQEGLLVTGNARTITPLTGANGNGELFRATFTVLASASSGNTAISVHNRSFLSTPTSHLNFAAWPSVNLIINNTATNIAPVTNLIAQIGSDRYSIILSWQASSTTNVHYSIYRKNPHQFYELLGSTDNLTFTDRDNVSLGGNIVPEHRYEYQVVATRDTQRSEVTTVIGEETRGLKADNNRSDRVDGGDLESIARLWTIDDTQSDFSPLVDTSFDGTISGSDLIDLAVNWAKTYP